MPDPFILKDKEMHSRMKRNAANAYSLNALVQMEPYVDRLLGLLSNCSTRTHKTEAFATLETSLRITPWTLWCRLRMGRISTTWNEVIG